MSTLEDYGIRRTDAFLDNFSARGPNYMVVLHLNYRLRFVLRTGHRLSSSSLSITHWNIARQITRSILSSVSVMIYSTSWSKAAVVRA